MSQRNQGENDYVKRWKVHTFSENPLLYRAHH